MFDYSLDGEIWLYDDIMPPGFGGIDSGSFINAMQDIGKKPITVRLNSAGGDVDEGTAIHNALQRHSMEVTTINDALAASIANYIFMAGDKRLVAKNARSMIHEPHSVTRGTADKHRAVADNLEAVGDTLAKVYADKMGKSLKDVKAMMKAETWLSPTDAVAAKMATALDGDSGVEPLKVAAGVFKHTPEDMVIRIAAGARHPTRRKVTGFEKYKKQTEELDAFIANLTRTP